MIGNGNESVLDEAKKITEGERKDDYGNAVDNFSDIASFWNGYLDVLASKKGITCDFSRPPFLGPDDIAHMMVLFKMAREVQKHKRDNLVDMAGYIRTAAQIKLGE